VLSSMSRCQLKSCTVVMTSLPPTRTLCQSLVRTPVFKFFNSSLIHWHCCSLALEPEGPCDLNFKF
jgi:hypothetical protein